MQQQRFSQKRFCRLTEQVAPAILSAWRLPPSSSARDSSARVTSPTSGSKRRSSSRLPWSSRCCRSFRGEKVRFKSQWPRERKNAKAKTFCSENSWRPTLDRDSNRPNALGRHTLHVRLFVPFAQFVSTGVSNSCRNLVRCALLACDHRVEPSELLHRILAAAGRHASYSQAIV